MYSKLRWRLSIYKLSETWVVQHLDDKIINYVKRWLHFHQGANLTHLKLAISKFGFGLQLVSDVFKYILQAFHQTNPFKIHEQLN